MSGKMARTKGQTGEREIVKLLEPIVVKYFPDIEMGRNLQQTREGGCDIECIPGFAIEVKRVESLSLGRWWQQTVEQAIRIKSTPVLLYRQNRKGWKAVISLYELLPEEVGTEYVHTVELGMDAFLLWFEDRLKRAANSG